MTPKNRLKIHIYLFLEQIEMILGVIKNVTLYKVMCLSIRFQKKLEIPKTSFGGWENRA